MPKSKPSEVETVAMLFGWKGGYPSPEIVEHAWRTYLTDAGRTHFRKAARAFLRALRAK